MGGSIRRKRESSGTVGLGDHSWSSDKVVVTGACPGRACPADRARVRSDPNGRRRTSRRRRPSPIRFTTFRAFHQSVRDLDVRRLRAAVPRRSGCQVPPGAPACVKSSAPGCGRIDGLDPVGQSPYDPQRGRGHPCTSSPRPGQTKPKRPRSFSQKQGGIWWRRRESTVPVRRPLCGRSTGTAIKHWGGERSSPTRGGGAGNRPRLYGGPLWGRSTGEAMTKPWEDFAPQNPNRVEAPGIEPGSENSSLAHLRT
jgi:hypothetical protein